MRDSIRNRLAESSKRSAYATHSHERARWAAKDFCEQTGSRLAGSVVKTPAGGEVSFVAVLGAMCGLMVDHLFYIDNPFLTPPTDEQFGRFQDWIDCCVLTRCHPKAEVYIDDMPRRIHP